MLISLSLSGELGLSFMKALETEGKTAQEFLRELIREKIGIYDNRDQVTCQRCKNSWMPRTEYPKFCPGCKSPGWNSQPLARTLYPGLMDLGIESAMLLPWDLRAINAGLPDPRPMRAVNYMRRRYGRKYRCVPKARGLEVLRLPDSPPPPTVATGDDLPV